MQVMDNESPYTCAQLKDPETGIKEGVRVLARSVNSARSLLPRYGATVKLNELAGAICNGGVGQSNTSLDCTPTTGWPAIPMWGCLINPGSAQFNTCAIKNYACNIGACV